MARPMNQPQSFPVPNEVRIPEVVDAEDGRAQGYTKHFLYNKLDHFGLDIYYYQPEEPVDEVPLIVIPGFAVTRVVYERLAEEMARKGRKVSLHLPPRKHSRRAAYSRTHLLDALQLQAQATRGNMKSIRAYSGEEQFDVIGHSMGNLIGVKALHPLLAMGSIAMVRSMLSDGGAGLNGPGCAIKYAKRLPNVVKNELVHGVPRMMEISPASMKSEATRHIVSSIGRLAREGYQVMMKAEVRDRVADLRDAGVHYGALLPEYDQFFPPEEILEHSEELLDWYRIIPEAYHVHANTHPVEHSIEVELGLMALNPGRITPSQAV